MCSCGTDCVDSAVNQEEIIKSRTPDYETFKTTDGKFTGFVAEAPLGTDDLMYAVTSMPEPTVWLEPGQAYLYTELTPEQQSIYDQGHRQGREDALNLAQAIAAEVGAQPDKPATEADVEVALDYLVESMNVNFASVIDAHNDLCEVVAGLVEEALDVDQVLALNNDSLERIIDRLEVLEDLVLPACDCGCGG